MITEWITWPQRLGVIDSSDDCPCFQVAPFQSPLGQSGEVDISFRMEINFISSWSKRNSWCQPRQAPCHPWHSVLLLLPLFPYTRHPYSIPTTLPNLIPKKHFLVNATRPSSHFVHFLSIPPLLSVILDLLGPLIIAFWKIKSLLPIYCEPSIYQNLPEGQSIPVSRMFSWHYLSQSFYDSE